MAIASEQSVQFTVLPSVNDARQPIFAVLTKRTYDIEPGGPATRAEKDQPLREIDLYYDGGDPETSTVRYESDLAPFKLATDVVVIGKAYAPEGRAVVQMDVAVQVGQYSKVIRMTGDRYCIYRQEAPPAFTDPQPFTEMEIRYDRAYGGVDERSTPGMPFYYPRNPMGKGLAVKNIPEAIHGLPLPNIEHSQDLLTPDRVVLGDVTRWNGQPLPQGFGWFQKTWYPRCSFVGAVPGFVAPDEVMREEQLGLVPQHQIALARQFKLPSYDVRFNNGASLGLGLPFLRGDEPIRLVHLTPDAELTFSLPNDRPTMTLDLGPGETELEPMLHTVSIRPDDMQVDLVWRGAHEYPGVDWLAEMTKMDVEIG